VLDIMFKTGHALPLVVTRILRPRRSRGVSANCSREVCGLWPRTRQLRELDSAGNRTRTGISHVPGQSVSAFNPRQQSRLRTVHIRARATASFVREQAIKTDAQRPQSVRSREQFTAANSPRTRTVHERGLAMNWPCRCLAVSMPPPVYFPVHVRIIPSNALV
jgi:hypothetical protein